MKAWFNIKPLYKKVGVITDVYSDYIELKETETNEYYIRHIDDIEVIK